ncbi:MAG: glycosyltransferase [bacterium]|nr:glycosyltransferase [bacterium]
MSLKPLRVTFLATLPLNSSTIVGRTIPLALELKKRGHEVNLITLGKIMDAPESSLIPTTIAGPSFRDGAKKPNIFKLLLRYLAAKKGLRDAVQKQNPDLIVLVKAHPQNFSAIKKITTPIILDSDDDEGHSSRSNALERMWLNHINKKAATKSQLITACSPYLVEQYKKISLNKPIELIPTAIPESTQNESINLRRYFDLGADSQIILYLGSLAISSGHRVDQILNAWNELSIGNLKLHLILAGDGIDADKIRAQAKLLSNSNRIHFFGRFQSNNSEDFARQANLLIDPIDNSIANQAKSSSRTMLALKSGTPIITGDVGIRKLLLPESIHSWTLYDPNQPETLIKCIKYGLTDEAKRKFTQATDGLWKQWTRDTIGAKFSSLIEGLIK